MLAGRQRLQRFTSLNANLSIRQSAKRCGCEARHALGLAFAVARQADDFLGDHFAMGSDLSLMSCSLQRGRTQIA